MSPSLHSPCAVPLHIESRDGGVVNVRVCANEEHDVFIAGHFERLADFPACGADRGKLAQHKSVKRILRVRQQLIKGCLRDGCQCGVAILDPAHAAGREDVCAVNDGVEKDVMNARCGRSDEKALDHWRLLDGFVCEGLKTARRLLRLNMGLTARAAQEPATKVS
ncbi:MAG TPA: hypothetical protein VFQ88_14165 [Nevskiaceae bacterium]|nr:hypothetical protein [Nevskiaceae bacterium]